MNLITREELKEKLDSGDDFRLVMVMDESAYRSAHIPGSINIVAPDIGKGELELEADIVVYCNGFSCPASVLAFQNWRPLATKMCADMRVGSLIGRTPNIRLRASAY